MLQKNRYRYIISGTEKRCHLTIAIELHEAIVNYAKLHKITITEATYNLLTTALRLENIEWRIIQ